jgi:hypothetical protein
MTLSRWRKVVETPEGLGQVSRGGTVVAAVRYALRVEVEELVAKTFGGHPKAQLGQRTLVTGRISISEGDPGHPAVGVTPAETMTLLLEDGRALDFSIIDADAGSGEYVIEGSGDFRHSGSGDSR